MNERIYTINELKTLISESASEFKAKVGDNVNSENEKRNKEAYKDADEKNKKLGGSKSKKPVKLDNKIDGNKTTLDYSLEANCGDNFREKIKAQAEGYTSTLEKNNKIEKAADFNGEIYNQFKEAGEEMADNKVKAKSAGLTASKLPKETFEKENLYKENKKISVLNFKNTIFLNENHMISYIPDEYKIEGNHFKMKDSNDNEFIVEWKENEAKVLFFENKRKVNECIEKFNKLSGYNSKTQFKNSTVQSRLNENQEFNKILNKMRIISENKK